MQYSDGGELMATVAPTLLLTCRACGWVPDLDIVAGDLAGHFEDDHNGAPVAMMMVSCCPRDSSVLGVRMTGVTPSGKNVTTYDCPKCQRTYRVKWDPTDVQP